MPFRDVVGTRRLIDLLSRSVAGGTLPPSLLFAGPAGVGKHLTALAVAQALNCIELDDGSGLRLRAGRRLRRRAPRARASPAACIPTSCSSLPATAARSRSIRSATSSIARSTARSKDAGASSSSTTPTRWSGGAERAAEDARRADALVGVHPGHVAARHAAADGAVALSAAAFPAAFDRRYRDGADGARTQRSRSARGRRDRRRQPRSGAAGQRRRTGRIP